MTLAEAVTTFESMFTTVTLDEPCAVSQCGLPFLVYRVHCADGEEEGARRWLDFAVAQTSPDGTQHLYWRRRPEYSKAKRGYFAPAGVYSRFVVSSIAPRQEIKAA